MKNLQSYQQYKFFSEMSGLAQQYGAYDLASGITENEVDSKLVAHLHQSIDNRHHQYEPLGGNPTLLERLVVFNKNREIPLLLDVSEIGIVPCSTFGVHLALKTVLNPGDEVIIIEPSYYTYAPNVQLNGGIPKYISLEDNFILDWQKLQDNITHKTKAIIVNTPQNPIGKIWSPQDWEQLYQIIKNKDIYIISEEVYDIYCYDGTTHSSAFHHEGLRRRAFCIFSFGKMFHTSGWKVNYILATTKLLKRLQFIQQYISYGSNTPSQYAIADYLTHFDPSENRKIMQNRRDLFYEHLKETTFNLPAKAQASFYQIANFRSINPHLTDIEFALWMTKEIKVACLPLSCFYHTKTTTDFVRFSFTKKEHLLVEAIEHLKKRL